MTDWDAEFAEFAARKSADAAGARMSGYRTIEARVAEDFFAIGTRWSQALFDGPLFVTGEGAGGPVVGLVFVQSADGNTVAANPSELGGGPTDKHLVYEGLTRVAADAILAGAGTVRGSGSVFSVWHPELVALRASFGLPRHPLQVVATSSGDVNVDREMIFNVPDVPVVMLTGRAGARTLEAAAAARPWLRVLETGAEPDLAAGLARLREEFGVALVSAVGGRTVATALLDAGLVSDVYLTTSPRAGGEPGTPFYAGRRPLDLRLAVRKEGLGEERGVIFEHLLVPSARSRSTRDR
jgi:riboflavin biosynthesis pyrimidine reductase